MSLFQHSVLNKYLKDAQKDEIKSAYDKLVQYFQNLIIQKNIRESKEEEFQSEFVRELFVNVLGYTLKPNPGFNIVLEKKNEGDNKKADGAILSNNDVLAVIELKGTDTTDLDKVETQVFGYKNHHQKCVYAISSNFEKLRFYIQNAVNNIEFDLFNIKFDDFAVLWLCLEKSNIHNNVPLKIKEASVLQEENISKKLYADYSKFRADIFNSLVKNNPDIDKLMLFKKTQKLLDRFLFIFFAEDRLLVPPNSISQIIAKWEDDVAFGEAKPLYNTYKSYFKVLNVGRPKRGNREEIFAYNGGLFQPDEILDNIVIDDELLAKHTKRLSEYDFETEVDVNILGHIFEHSLGEIENVQAEIKGEKIDVQKTKRKKDGIFYTPKYITKYIVENTVGKLCIEKRNELVIIDEEYAKGRRNRKKGIVMGLDKKLNYYREWLLNITILDPACGSGAFLNQALEFLIAEHKKIDELRAQLLGGAIVFSDITADILERNIYGVDLNDESVEIAKLSLWLRTAQKGRKLNTLSNNIKCGNSLIDDPENAGEKAFKWENEFPAVFAKGGFDVVIGNPPYGASFFENDKKYIIENYKSYQYKFESYLYFYEKGINILKKEGYLSFITPELFLRLEKSKNIRQFLLNESCLLELKFCGENVFEDVKVNSVILTLQKGKVNSKSFVIIPQDGPSWNYEFSEWMNESLLKIDYELSPSIRHIIKKIETSSVKLGDIGEAIQGLTPYDSYRGHSKELIKNREFHVNEKIDESCGKWLDGKHVNRYRLAKGDEWLKYGDWLAAPREKRFFEGARLIYREVPGQNKRIQATFVEETYYHGHSITPFILENRSSSVDLFPILAVSNAKLISWYIKFKSSNFAKNTFPKLNPKDIKELPIPKNYREYTKLGDKARNLLQKNTDLYELSSKFLMLIQSKLQIDKINRNLQNWFELEVKIFLNELKKAKIKLSLPEEVEWIQYFNEQKIKAQTLKTEIEKTDQEVDRMVYELYGLTLDEIKIIEDSVK